MVVMWNLGDRDMVRSVAQGMGRDWRIVGQAADQLPRFHSLTIPQGKVRGPMILTHAPKLPGKPKSQSRPG